MNDVVSQTHYLFYGTGKEPIVNLGLVALVGSMVCIGLALGVIIAVGGLFVIQVSMIANYCIP